MKSRYVLVIVSLLLLVPMLAFGQQTLVIKGKVVDKDGNPLPGANVMIEGTAYGAATDANGNYFFRVPETMVKGQEVQLIARFIGYKVGRATVKLSPGEIVQNFSLEVDPIGLEEVVVVGYGTALKEELTGSVKTIASPRLEQLPASSFQDAIQGTPGVQVVAADGAPGAGIQIRIRGIGSISASNEPLYVIDGVPVIAGAVSITDFGNYGRSANVLNLINPNDIESIVIAKDAASTAIYGSRGANGVVFITTKGGVGGKRILAEKPRFDIKLQRGYSDFAFGGLDSPLDSAQYHQLFLEGYMNRGWSREKAEAKFNQWYPKETRANTNWWDAITHVGTTNQLNISAQGGGERYSYYVSGNVFDQEGVVIQTFFNRYTGRANLTMQLTDRLSLANNITVAYSMQRGITDGTRWQSPMYNAYLLAPTIPIYDQYGQFYADHKSFFMGGNNPVGHLHEDKRHRWQKRFIENFALTYKLRKDLTFRSNWNFDVMSIGEYLYVNPRYGDGRNVGGAAQEARIGVINWQHHQTLTYENTFAKKHNVEVLFGFEQQKVSREEVYTAGEGFPHPSLKTLATAANPTSAYSARTEYAFMSYFSRLLYNYQHKYYFSASYRRDGSSRFGPKKRWGDFWSVGLGYTITEEPFMKNVPFINYMKIRTSYGETGNAEIGNYAWAGLYGFAREYDGKPGAAPTQIANPYLTWEKQGNFNFAVDYAVLDNRLSGTIEYFNRKSSALLLNRPLSYTTGFRSVLENVGGMVNKGWEFSVEADVMRGNRPGLAVNFGITTMKNEVTEIVEPILSGVFKRTKGHDFYEYWLYQWAGVDPETGDPLWYTDSTRTTTTNKIGEAVRVYTGKSALPKFYGSFGFNFRYGRLTVTAQFNYQFGHYLYYNPGWVIHGDGRFTPRSTTKYAFEHRWTKPGDKALFPKFVWGGNKSSNARNSTRYLYKGDWVRMKTFKISYKLPDLMAFRAGMRSIEVYLELLNYWTWAGADYIPFDPEQAVNGIYNTTTPIPKTATIGINLGL
jgi:TonB-linked SusC/RagA family outer membrane protein